MGFLLEKPPIQKWMIWGEKVPLFSDFHPYDRNMVSKTNTKLRKLPRQVGWFHVKKNSPESNHQNVLEYKSTRRIKWSTPPFMSDAWKYMETHEKIIFLITSILCKKSSTVGFPRKSKDVAISSPVIYQSNGRIRDYKKHTKTQKHIKYPSQ